MTDWPKITLVTPSFNQGQFLEATLDSVLGQGYPNLEYRVIDGGSTDASVGILERYSKHLDFWVSEPDAGQADALIKGFRTASGDLMNWINSDDLLRPGALFAVAEAWMQEPTDLIVGEDIQFQTTPEAPVGHFFPAGYRYPECLRFWDDSFRYHQPPTFFSRRAYEAVGGLSRDLHYVMDYDLYCRMLRLPSVAVRYLDRVLSAFRLHAAAKTTHAKARFLLELRGVSRPNWPSAWSVAAESAAMDRYSAECSVFQAAESLRGGHYGIAATALMSALRYAPMHAANLAAQRVWKRAHA